MKPRPVQREISHTEQPAVYYEALICSIVEGTLSTQASEGLVDMFKKVTEKELMSSHDRQKARGDIGQRAIYIFMLSE